MRFVKKERDAQGKKKITERQTHPLAMGNESVAVICGFTHVKKENLHSHANFGAEMVFRKALGRDTVLRRKRLQQVLDDRLL